jgi:hypothetical protein
MPTRQNTTKEGIDSMRFAMNFLKAQDIPIIAKPFNSRCLVVKLLGSVNHNASPIPGKQLQFRSHQGKRHQIRIRNPACL